MDRKALDVARHVEAQNACLEMLSVADRQAPQTAAIAARNRALRLELEMEAEYLRQKAAERGPVLPAGPRDEV
jgi:hypothetical protein